MAKAATAPPFTRRFTAKQKVTLWGKAHTVKPACVRGWVGDGTVMISVCPLATRPNWYWVRVDSSWLALADLHDVIGEVHELIADEFSTLDRERENYRSDGLTDDEIERDKWDAMWFPVLHEDCGIAWCIEAVHDGRRWVDWRRYKRRHKAGQPAQRKLR